MCLVLLALDSVPGYPLVLAANREEHHARPADPLHWWTEPPWLAGGRDRLAGGTWLGVRRDGRCATVLNAAEAAAPAGARSRGELVLRFLRAADAAAAGAALQASSGDYAGFHFIAADIDGGWYLDGRAGRLARLRAGLHAADRAGLDPDTPRVAHARDLFRPVAHQDPAALLEVLANEDPPPRRTGDQRPVFLRGADFGTRCSTVLRISDIGQVELIERRFGPNGRPAGETRLTWQRKPITAELE